MTTSWVDKRQIDQDIKFLTAIPKAVQALGNVLSIDYQYNSRQLVFQKDKVKIYHYRPTQARVHSTPLLVVFATVNRPEILDLFPERSFIRGLLESGMEVYLLDWGYPDINDQKVTIDDYITCYLQSAVTFVCENANVPKINLLGICQGGVLSICYASLYENVNKLVLISTPIDFCTKENLIGKLFSKVDIDSLIALTGNLSGMWLTNFFISLRPFELVGKKYLRMLDNIDNAEWISRFLRVEKWLYDAPDQTGASFQQLVKSFYQENQLINHELFIDHQRIDLAKLSLPILNVMAAEDEIVPPSASRCLKKLVTSTDYQQKTFPSGHIGIYISDRVGLAMPQYIAKWLRRK